MESMSLEQREAVLDVLQNIKNSIIQLREWNKDILEVNDLLITTEGIKTLTADHKASKTAKVAVSCSLQHK